MGKKRIRVFISSFIIAMLLFAFLGNTKVSAAQVIEVNLSSGAARGGEYIPANEGIVNDAEGKNYKLIMNGLKAENKVAFIEAIADYFDPDEEVVIKINDDALPDAEKYSWYPDTNIDDALCWAASVANQLQITGWAKQVNNPKTNLPFASEDEVFTYYNNSFTNAGCGRTAGAIDWFFMGEFYNPSFSSAANLIEPTKATHGLMREFVSTLIQDRYDLVANPENISMLLDSGGEAVYQASIGTLYDERLDKSSHSVTILGVITDPSADPKNLGEYYKGVIIADSDNDAIPQGSLVPTEEQIIAERLARPNSATVYPLRYAYDIDGTPFWEIVGYDDSGYGETEALYNINRLPMYSESLIAANTETLGNRSVIDTPDLTAEFMFTTDIKEKIVDLYGKDLEDLKVNEFNIGEAVNLSFFIGNRSPVTVFFDENAPENAPSADWKVVRNSDGVTVASGKQVLDGDIHYNNDTGFMIHLNEKDSKIEFWPAGEYTVTLDLNADKSFAEAYYLNNIPLTYSFTILGDSEGAADDEDVQVPEENTVQTGDKNGIVAWGLALGMAIGAIIITAKFKSAQSD